MLADGSLILKMNKKRQRDIKKEFQNFFIHFQILAMSFGGHKSLLEMKAEPQIWTSASTCFLFFTLPLVTGPLAVLGHTLAIYMELLLRSWSLAKHSIILASTKTLIHGLHVLIGTHIHEYTINLK